MKANEAEPLQDAVTVQVGPPTVVVAEDDPLVLEFVTAMLGKWGYHVLPAPDPIEALSLARCSPVPIDLLLTDINMPDMDGIHLWRRLRSVFPDAKVVFMSGQNPTSQLRGKPFLSKPFGHLELRRVVETVLPGNSPLDAAPGGARLRNPLPSRSALSSRCQTLGPF